MAHKLTNRYSAEERRALTALSKYPKGLWAGYYTIETWKIISKGLNKLRKKGMVKTTKKMITNLNFKYIKATVWILT